MAKELTNSPVVRQKILNNSLVLQQLKSDMQLGGRFFENELVFTKLQVGEILDVALRTIESKSGGDTKFINQRDINYLPTALVGENYRKNFTDSLGAYVDLVRVKYPIYTNKIYQIVFRENAVVVMVAADKISRELLRSIIIEIIANGELSEAIKVELLDAKMSLS